MRCESCRTPGADTQCNAWIDCEGPVQALEVRTDRADSEAEVGQALADFGSCRRCGGPVTAEYGYDEDEPMRPPARVLACSVCGWER